jgi:hypothetical protein
VNQMRPIFLTLRPPGSLPGGLVFCLYMLGN